MADHPHRGLPAGRFQHHERPCGAAFSRSWHNRGSPVKVILAEKPSVAREIAACVGAQTRCEGYFEGSTYQVTWALGHLVALKEPDEYDPALKKWALEPLPFIPERFELKVINDARARQQFAVVKRLFRAATEIVCATDAGREGELIFRYILAMSGCEKKPCRRLWLSSLTRQAIDAAFQRLKPGRDYDPLYAAAKCRSEADWIVGMNGTRYQTVRFGSSGILWSVGRVQTPVLAMIVRRDDEIRTFQPKPFWELVTRYRDTQFKFDGERFDDEAKAQQLLDKVRNQPLTITQIEHKRERTPPPQLYDLTELQREMNRRFGLSAAATLEAAQSLYESKLITYPRTDSRYLTSDMKQEVPKILRSLRDLRPKEIAPLDLASLGFSGRIVDDRKVSDHHAIIPTGSVPGTLSSAQQKVYDAIVTRLIAAFYPPCEKEVTTVRGISNEVPFRARGHRVLEAGWTALYPRPKTEEPDDDSQQLPAFERGERGPHEPAIHRGETTPPKSYTENTLLGAMETAGKQVDDEQLRELLKEKGLGTPATCAAIIETLLKRSYIERQQKTLTATDLGRYLIATVQSHELKSPELTGRWEGRLREIEAGRLDPARFLEEIADYARRIVARDEATWLDETKFGDCPRCGRPVIQGKRGFGCSGWRDGCTFVLWPEYRGQPLRPEDIRQLIQRRVLQRPMRFDDQGEVLLTLTDGGQLSEVPVPTRNQQPRSGPRTRGEARAGDPAEGQGTGRRKRGANLVRNPRRRPPSVRVPCAGRM